MRFRGTTSCERSEQRTDRSSWTARWDGPEAGPTKGELLVRQSCRHAMSRSLAATAAARFSRSRATLTHTTPSMTGIVPRYASVGLGASSAGLGGHNRAVKELSWGEEAEGGEGWGRWCVWMGGDVCTCARVTRPASV